MAGNTVRVFEVLHDTDGEGITGDGTVIARFRRAGDAERFAAGKTCYGQPAKSDPCVVSRRLAQRWGMA